MAKRLLVLVGVLVLFGAFEARAESCVTCESVECQRNGTIVIANLCSSFETYYGYGHRDCRNIFNCGGCMGWTCYRYIGDIPQSLELEDVSIEVTPLRATAEAESCEPSSR